MVWGSSLAKRVDPLYQLSDEALETLADILCYPTNNGDTEPSKEWLRQVRDRTKKCLYQNRHLNLHRGLTMATFFGLDDVVWSRLCKYHHYLDPELLFWCFAQLYAEVSDHVDRYRAYRSKHRQECSDELRDFVDRITSVVTLVISRHDFDYEYGSNGVPDGYRYRHIHGRCAGCILSVVGSRAQMLVDLRANMLARQNRRTPRFLPLIEAWIDGFGKELATQMRRESDDISVELREVRAVVMQAEAENKDKERDYAERQKQKRVKHRARASFAGALANFLGIKFGKKKDKEGKKDDGSSGGAGSGSGSRRDSSSTHGSSTQRGSSSRAGSAYNDISSRSGSATSRQSGTSSRHSGPQSEHVDRHSSRPASTSSRVASWDDGHGSQSAYSNMYQDQEEADYSNPGGHSRYSSREEEDAVSIDTPRSPRAGSTTSDRTPRPYSTTSDRVPRPYSTTSSRHSAAAAEDYIPARANWTRPQDPPLRDPHRSSPPPPTSPRPTSTASDATVRPSPRSGGRHSAASWTSSVYSTNDDGLRAGDAGFDATRTDGYRVDLGKIARDAGFEEGDVAMSPEVAASMCDVSDSEDEDEEEPEPEEVCCPVCMQSLAGLSAEVANAHANACVDGRPMPIPRKKGRPAGGRRGGVADVTRRVGGLGIIDEDEAGVRRAGGGPPAVRRERGGTRRSPSVTGLGVSDEELGPDDSASVIGGLPGQDQVRRRERERAREERERDARGWRRQGGSDRGSVAGSSASTGSAMGRARFRDVHRRPGDRR